MPAVAKKTAGLIPVEISRSITISGGFSKKKWVLTTHQIDFGQEIVECAVTSVQEAWVSEMASGMPVCKRGLARVSILKKIKEALMSEDHALPEDDDKLAALSFDVEDSVVAESTPTKRKRETSTAVEKIKKIRARAVDVPLSSVDVTSQTRQIKAAMLDAYKLCVAIDDLPWLIQRMIEERATGGVPLIESPEKGKRDSQSIAWNFRDNAWQAKAQTPAGKALTHTKCVARRMAKAGDVCFGKSWPEAKNIVLEEMQQWVDAVEAGDVQTET